MCVCVCVCVCACAAVTESVRTNVKGKLGGKMMRIRMGGHIGGHAARTKFSTLEFEDVLKTHVQCKACDRCEVKKACIIMR